MESPITSSDQKLFWIALEEQSCKKGESGEGMGLIWRKLKVQITSSGQHDQKRFHDHGDNEIHRPIYRGGCCVGGNEPPINLP